MGKDLGENSQKYIVVIKSHFGVNNKIQMKKYFISIFFIIKAKYHIHTIFVMNFTNNLKKYQKRMSDFFTENSLSDTKKMEGQ